MKSPSARDPPHSPDAPLQMATETGNELSGILTDAAQDLCKCQSEFFASGVAECFASVVPLFAPGNQGYFLSTLPTWCESLSERTWRSLLDCAWVLSRTQQKLFEWQVHSVSGPMGRATGPVVD